MADTKKSLRRYRMEISASICFDVEAASEEEAIAQGNKLINAFDGIDLEDPEGCKNAVLWTDDSGAADIMDIDEEIEHPQTDEHLAGCASCMMAHDKGLPNA
jgi:hypothetical protein